ncbi:DUF5825 family protein [Saccharothrix xinjiangensis]|uniref:DUF5825 family protein n=1 Tax=Saccharothrix xinjiangensis TaxID=204798 RepID=A0ABV9Y4S2_9PSEU
MTRTTTGAGLVTREPREQGTGRTLVLPDWTAAAPAEVAAAGYGRVLVEEPVPAGADLDDDLRVLRFLRECTSHALRLDWVLGGRPLVGRRDLHHLVPPARGVGDAAECAAAWRAAYRYGAYYYRVGPGFVTVKDVRPDGEAAHLTIDGESADHFRALAEATSPSELDEATTGALADAVEFGLALRGEETVLVLPFRMRHWPVPYVAA